MDGILNWYREEHDFKGGSGSGINLSNIPLVAEHLKGGGTASGRGFMRGADGVGRHHQSGGKTRRAPKRSSST